MRPEIRQWAATNIQWAGNHHTNRSDRRGYLPEVIVDHITEMLIDDVVKLFTSSENEHNSTHFAVARDGQVYQFVAIEDNAWGNGITADRIPLATAEIVKAKGVNPNWYSVSIEHEGFSKETLGELTPAQLRSTTMLHAYIMDYVWDTWRIAIPVARTHIIGHGEIDPARKWFCPGEKYPFESLFAALRNLQSSQ